MASALLAFGVAGVAGFVVGQRFGGQAAEIERSVTTGRKEIMDGRKPSHYRSVPESEQVAFSVTGTPPKGEHISEHPSYRRRDHTPFAARQRRRARGARRHTHATAKEARAAKAGKLL